jgi:alpha-D-ribose 1-methylphosphonate 5-phosphate C-P lyase
VTTTYDYPVMVNGRYVMAPSPIPKFDNPKMQMSPALQLFGAGREKRIYAVPPHTSVRSLDFDDHPFRIQSWEQPCALCGAADSYLDEVVIGRPGRADVRLLRQPPLRDAGGPRAIAAPCSPTLRRCIWSEDEAKP